MPRGHSDEAKSERDSIAAEIHQGFDAVRRGPGISWSETVAIDNYEPDDKCAEARRADRDSHWTQLVNDPKWTPFPGIGGFAFIDEAGFRYYLPATMMRFIRGDVTEWYPGHFLEAINRFVENTPGFWTADQVRCVAGFIQFMSRHDSSGADSQMAWAQALERRWKARLDS